ncbi:MAG TPA: aromatic acid exporter family protein, partial [Acholeplasmataceae bacterium]|nr:aromatic acid exporter family protein [Acholeplasmataceae bacterium]
MYYKHILHTTIKLAIVAVLSATIAYLVGITDYILVGTIGILSVSLTRKDAIKDNINRYIDVLLGLVLSSIIFILFGFNLYALMGFVVLFIFISYVFKMNIGLIPALVLVKHLY